MSLRNSFIVSVGFVLWLQSGAHAHAQTTPVLRLVTMLALDRPVMVAERQVLDQAFARAGLRFVLEYNPAERALTGFLNGTFDGDVNRITTFHQNHAEAVRVEPHVQSAFFYAVGHVQSQAPASWQDLVKYRIAYVRGFKGIEIRTAAVPQRTITDSDEACLRMAQARRVDWCVLPADRKGEWPLHEQFGAPMVGAIVDTVKAYIWLGPQHKEAAEQLTRVLREMDRSGELQKLMAPYRQPE